MTAIYSENSFHGGFLLIYVIFTTKTTTILNEHTYTNAKKHHAKMRQYKNNCEKLKKNIFHEL